MEKFRLFAAHRAGTEGLTLTVNVLLERNSSHGRIYECNVIASMLGCRDKYTDKPVPAWFVKQAAVPGRFKYINTKNSLNVYRKPGSNCPRGNPSRDELKV